jgi:drug/metabolite transporter (DMT)-like permease
LKDKVINWGIFIILSLIWGSSFKLMKIGMETLSPYHVASLRMLSAGVVLLPFTIKAVREIPRKKIGTAILSGLLGSFFPAYLFCIAETRIDSSLAGILNALTPLFTIFTGLLFFKARVPVQSYVGVIIGFSGLSLLFILRGNISFSYILFALLVLLATFLYGINVNIVARYLHLVSSLKIATIAFSFLIIPSVTVLIATGYFSIVFRGSDAVVSTVAGVVLGVFGTAIATVLFYILVKRAGGLFASMVTYGIPFVAVFWGLLSNEQITLGQVGCLGIILCGVYLVNQSKKVLPNDAVKSSAAAKPT